MTNDDIAYYQKRVQQELRAAQIGAPSIAALHRRMAEHYRLRLKAAGVSHRPAARLVMAAELAPSA